MTTILEQLSASGIRISVTPDGRLAVTPRDRVTPDLAQAIKANRAEILKALSPSVKYKPAPAGLTPFQERSVLTWLAGIGETDPGIIREVLERCRTNPEALSYFLRRARHAEALALLADRDRAFVVDADLDPVIITVAIRAVAVFDLEVPRDRWSPTLFVKYLEERKQ